ncbi:MAG: glycoside hydrolase family 2 [Candidatus Bathyarchaeota archaeon B26-2]|nr:MAG: glycoside hydrolase family 2 [Candidatus Bathyarchaeota archaeon B26-2]
MAGSSGNESGLPRPEHPRPDFFRREWLNLNGWWGFRFDDYNLGMREGWHLGREEFDGRIRVPFPFQSKLSGVHDEGIHEVVWYRRRFSIPEEWKGRRVLLHFGAVDYEAKVWLNGHLLGSNVGGYVPFTFDITALMEPENILTLRVYDPNGEQPRGKQDPRPHPHGVLYTRITGIWQTVWLEAVGESYISSIRVVPNVDDGRVSVNVRIMGETEGCALSASVYFAGIVEAEAEKPAEGGEVHLEVPLSEVKLWSPDVPDLYDIRLRVLRGDEAIDEVESYFGMRKVSVEGGRFLLNNEPYYLKMALDQGYYPDGLYTAPTDSDLKRDVEAAKRLGLNGVRKHQIAPDPRYLYWCDKIGLLVWGEMGDWGMPLNRFEAFWEEWRRVVERDFNHPSVVVWVPFNERNEARRGQENQRALVEVYRRTKDLDPTRPVVDTSGYSHTETDILDIHNYRWKSGRDWRNGWSKPWREGKTPRVLLDSLAEGFEYKGQPIVISEFGGWEIEPYKPIVDRPIEPRRLTLKDEYEFISRYRDVVGAIMEEGSICGFCYTQLYDVEGEVNGFLTYDRKWKVRPEAIAEIHARLHAKPA